MLEQQVKDYLLETLENQDDWVKEMERYAAEERVPIMEPLGIDFLMQLVRMKKPNKILEIGTAIGYSALRMLQAYPDTKIVTIERDEVRYKEAISRISQLDKSNHITVIFGDALEQYEEIAAAGPYDLLFIDAAKGQYQKFFEIYSSYLSEDAVIISDNVLYKGLVVEEAIEKSRKSNIAKKVRNYNDWLINHPDYKTSIIPIGDGVAISVKR